MNKIVINEFYRHFVCPYLCLSVCIKHLSSRWTEFHEVWFRSF